MADKKISSKRKDFILRLQRRYGTRKANIYLFCERWWKAFDQQSTSSLLYVVDELVLHGSDQDLKEFRDSRASMCVTTGVAAAVFTQVALTALALPSIATAHWLARGFWAVSLCYGYLGVRTSVSKQAMLSSWLDPKQIRDNLSFQKVDEQNGEKCTGGAIDPVLGLAAPGRLLRFSSSSFCLGFAVFLGTVWTSGGNNVPGPNDTRNIFISFICAVGFELFKGIVVLIITSEDDHQRDMEETEDEEGAPKATVAEPLKE